MRLKNFLKKQKETVKKTKTFHTTLKQSKKQTRADEKAQKKSKRRTVSLILFATFIFALVLVLFLAAYLYNNYIFKNISATDIISPGNQIVIEVDAARQILMDNNIEIKTFGYSSGSASLTLNIDNGPIVYFSDFIEFDKQVELLDKILYSLKNEGRNARIIDLRYNRPIVKF